jgi:D-alanine-D-alanine ligase
MLAEHDSWRRDGKMRIGLVYDLRDDYRALGFSEEAVAEFDTPETIDGIAAALERCGCKVERVGGGRALAKAFTGAARFDLVFSIAEGVKGRNREGQVPSLCELYDQPYAFSDALTVSATLDKAVAKRIVRDGGIPTADFAVLRREEDARTVTLPFPLFVKPIAEGTGKGCERASKIYTRGELAEAATSLVRRFDQPAIAEPFLPGREFTVGLVGTGDDARVIAVMEVLLNAKAEEGVYSYTNKEECEDRVVYKLADDAEARRCAEHALAAYGALECRDAARLDFRSDDRGVPQFLEANPLAGLNEVHSDLPILTRLAGKSYDWLIGEILKSAAKRYGLALPSPLKEAVSAA